ncbi:hypothetical protein Pmani_008535 [Petrolisthes manimaculis]|uniref:Uncharacterized protein n=1 Tax=Petrolisthes manimaculis TaxID=1843537 RepID=A0AAE1Q8E4_9EUCA|nr:hypothetical protein Pmani_008535 [Petrolisthes manimaculis]
MINAREYIILLDGWECGGIWHVHPKPHAGHPTPPPIPPPSPPQPIKPPPSQSPPPTPPSSYLRHNPHHKPTQPTPPPPRGQLREDGFSQQYTRYSASS